MKKLLVFSFVLLSSLPHLFAQEWKWAKHFSGGSDDRAREIVVDPFGYQYIYGEFQGSLTLGDSTFNTQNITYNVYLAKLDTSGNVVWAREFGGDGYDWAGGVAVDKIGNVYITGGFAEEAHFGNKVIYTDDETVSQFVAMLNKHGQVYWAKSLGGSGIGLDIDVSDDFDVAVTGFYEDTMVLGNDTLFPGSDDYNWQGWMVLKMDPFQNIEWAYGGSTGNYNQGTAVAFDESGNIYSAGLFSGTATFDTITASTPKLWFTNIYLSKYNSNGQVLWLNHFGGGRECRASDIEVEGDSVIYLTGNFRDTIHLGTDTLITNGFKDALVAKVYPDGSLGWMINAGCPCSHDGAGTVVADFDGLPIINFAFTDTAYFDSLVIPDDFGNNITAKLDHTGKPIWIIQETFGPASLARGKFNSIYGFGAFGGQLYIEGLDSLYYYSGTNDIIAYRIRTLDSIYQEPQSVPQYRTANNFQLYPNPNKGSFYVSMGSEEGDQVMLAVRDITGKVVHSQTVQTNKKAPVQLPATSKGVYIIEATIGQRKYYSKFIVQ